MSKFRPIRLPVVALVWTVALVVCASEDDVSVPATSSASTSGPAASAPAAVSAPAASAPAASAGSSAPTIDHPRGADQTVVELVEAGGIGPEGSDFGSPPSVLVLGDGTVIRPGPQIQVYPGPMLPALTTAQIDEPALQGLLAQADAEGLLTSPPPAYDEPPGTPQVADAPATTLELDAGGARNGPVVHQAYGLVTGGVESTPARQRLARFVAVLRGLRSGAGGLSAEARYQPSRFGVIARPATAEERAPSDEGVAPAVLPWPAAAGRLADSHGRCVEVPASVVGPTLEGAKATDRFSQDGTTYVVFVRVLLPGEACSQFS